MVERLDQVRRGGRISASEADREGLEQQVGRQVRSRPGAAPLLPRRPECPAHPVHSPTSRPPSPRGRSPAPGWGRAGSSCRAAPSKVRAASRARPWSNAISPRSRSASAARTAFGGPAATPPSRLSAASSAAGTASGRCRGKGPLGPTVGVERQRCRSFEERTGAVEATAGLGPEGGASRAPRRPPRRAAASPELGARRGGPGRQPNRSRRPAPGARPGAPGAMPSGTPPSGPADAGTGCSGRT